MEKLRNLIKPPTETEAQTDVLQALFDARRKHKKVGFVPGVVLSESKAGISINLLKLAEYHALTRLKTLKEDMAIFSALNFAKDEVVLREEGHPYQDLSANQFVWEVALEEGIITDIFFQRRFMDHPTIAIEMLMAARRGKVRRHYFKPRDFRLPSTPR